MKNTVVAEILARKAELKITNRELADRLHKDEITVSRQIGLKGEGKAPSNLTLAVLDEYAEALSGRLMFIPDNYHALLEGEGLVKLQQRFAEISSENEYLKEKLNAKDAALRDLRRGIDLRDNQLMHKDKVIEDQQTRFLRMDDEERQTRKVLDDQYRQIIELQQRVMELQAVRPAVYRNRAPDMVSVKAEQYTGGKYGQEKE